MKTKDIKKGAAYAWRGSMRATQRVVVLDVGVEHKTVWSGVVRKEGVRVKTDYGVELIVPSREIVEQWSDREARNAAIKEREREMRAREAKEKEANRRLVEMLARVGVTAARAAGMGVVIPAESHAALIEVCRDAEAYRRSGR